MNSLQFLTSQKDVGWADSSAKARDATSRVTDAAPEDCEM